MQIQPRGRWRYFALGLLALVTIGVVVFALMKPRLVTTAAASASAQPSAPAATSPTPTPTPSPTLRAVVLGDGYAVDAAWLRLLGEELGAEVVNLSEDGMGFRVAPRSCQTTPCTPFRGLVPQVVELNPDIVLVTGGEADGDYELKPFVEPLLTDLVTQLPEATIVVLTPPSSESPRPYWLRLHTQTLQDAAPAAGARYVDTSRVVGNAQSYADGALTDAANTALATLVAAGLG